MAKKTRTELSTLAINTNLPDNTTELITPTTERAQLTDERESVVNYKDDLGGVPNAGKFLTVAVDGESLTMVDAPTGDVTGTGTQYQLAVWDGTSALTGYAALTYINSILQAPELRADSTNGTVTINATDASGGTAWLYFQNASVLKAEISYFIQDDFLTIRTYQKDIVFERAVNTPTLTIDGTTGDATFDGALNGTTAAFTSASGAHIGVTSEVTDATGSSRLRAKSTGNNVTDLTSYSASHPSRANQAWIGGDGASTTTVIQSGGVAKISIGSNWANTLDAYEEGTWTSPQIQGTTTGGTVSGGTVTSHYTRIGNMIHAYVRFGGVTVSNASGGIKITGLPFAEKTSTFPPTANFGINGLPFTNTSIQYFYMQGSALYGYEFNSGGTGGSWSIPTTATYNADISITYQV